MGVELGVLLLDSKFCRFWSWGGVRYCSEGGGGASSDDGDGDSRSAFFLFVAFLDVG